MENDISDELADKVVEKIGDGVYKIWMTLCGISMGLFLIAFIFG
jgi:hypothetical protein